MLHSASFTAHVTWLYNVPSNTANDAKRRNTVLSGKDWMTEIITSAYFAKRISAMLGEIPNITRVRPHAGTHARINARARARTHAHTHTSTLAHNSQPIPSQRDLNLELWAEIFSFHQEVEQRRYESVKDGDSQRWQILHKQL